MTVEVGQIRRWKRSTASAGDVFMVIAVDDAGTYAGPRRVKYISGDKEGYDDFDWVLENSELLQ